MRQHSTKCHGKRLPNDEERYSVKRKEFFDRSHDGPKRLSKDEKKYSQKQSDSFDGSNDGHKAKLKRDMIKCHLCHRVFRTRAKRDNHVAEHNSMIWNRLLLLTPCDMMNELLL